MAKRNAIITASYAPDFERCAILCETMDRHATGYDCHYLLVDEPDVPLFKRLEGPKRRILTDSQLLPWWLRRMPAAISPKRRRVWVSPLTAPLHGWHTQQIMRIAVAHHIDADGLLYCDSDTAFVRHFDAGDIWNGGDMRLYRDEDGVSVAESDHASWAEHAARSLQLPAGKPNPHNYVCSFVTWKRQTVLDMCAHIEKVRRRPWVSVVGSTRKFSECMLYGAYVDSVLGGAGHFHDAETYCPMQWCDPAPTRSQIDQMIDDLSARQVAIGIQSFIPLAATDFRTAVTGLKEAA